VVLERWTCRFVGPFSIKAIRFESPLAWCPREKDMTTKKAVSAKEALERARQQYDKAQEHSDDPDQVFVWCFYALENAVVAAATHANEQFQKNHWTKAEAARRLARDEGLTDVSDMLRDLNDARKGTAYGDIEEPEIEPEEVLTDVGNYIKEVENLLTPPKKGK
jgi:hypothetical protein